jgi:anti-repressor protein
MNEIKVINEQEVLGKNFKVYGDFQNPLFVAKDVAQWIDYDASSINKMLASVDEDEKARKIIPTLGGKQEVWLLTENGLYEVLMLSRKPIAKSFKKRVKEILRELRQTGVVTASNDDEAILNAMTILQRRLEAQKIRADYETARADALEKKTEKQAAQIEERDKQRKKDLPKLTFAHAVATSDKSVLVGELAKIICQNGVNIGQNRLFLWLRENGYLGYKGEYYNMPSQKSMNAGLMEVKKTSIVKPDGTTLVTTTPKITGKGQIYFVDKFLTDK